MSKPSRVDYDAGRACVERAFRPAYFDLAPDEQQKLEEQRARRHAARVKDEQKNERARMMVEIRKLRAELGMSTER